MGKSLDEIFAAYPVDQTTGRDLKRRESNRARILLENLEQARPYIQRPSEQPDELLDEKHHSENLDRALSWLLLQIEGDVVAKKILILIVKYDYEYGDSKALAEKCGVSIRLITAAKERMRYKFRRLGATNFEELLIVASERFGSHGR